MLPNILILLSQILDCLSLPLSDSASFMALPVSSLMASLSSRKRYEGVVKWFLSLRLFQLLESEAFSRAMTHIPGSPTA